LTKTRLQTAAPGVYKGAVDVVKQTLARDGITGYVSRQIFEYDSEMLLQDVSWDGTPAPRCHPNIRRILLGPYKFIIFGAPSYHHQILFPPQAYDTSKKLIFKMTPKRTTEHLSLAELATAGFMSAVPTTLVTAPVERAKVVLQVSRACTPISL
jgi:solute carrier family 25 carnitine/acylcarnitine transporter 20/29